MRNGKWRGGKVSSWQDADGDWLESGLHVFFGAYRNLLGFLRETNLYDNLVWMPHALTFSAEGGKLSPLAFPKTLPAPLHGLVAIARSRGVLTHPDKLRTGLGLLWPILGSQRYINAQDKLTWKRWHLRHGLSKRSLGDFFDTMALALNFLPSSAVSAKLLLTVLSHFGKETDASRVAFLKGPPELRLFRPLLQYLEKRGVDVRFNSKVRSVRYSEPDGVVTGFELEDGSVIEADLYMSAMPVHNLWKILPPALRAQAPFDGLRHLHGVPVMTVQLYFDRPVTGVNNLIFSSRSHISVYAELGCHMLRLPRRTGWAFHGRIGGCTCRRVVQADDATLICPGHGRVHRLATLRRSRPAAQEHRRAHSSIGLPRTRPAWIAIAPTRPPACPTSSCAAITPSRTIWPLWKALSSVASKPRSA